MDSILFADNIRTLALSMVHKAKASHIGGALSMADVLAVLYTKILNVDPAHPQWEGRDRFLLSKGHACTSLYAALALKGFITHDELATYAQDGSRLMPHASHKVPGVELSTGSLGHALSVGCGIALAAQKKKKMWKTFVLLSDGELDEGSNWEALLFAPQHHLEHLCVIIDYNKIQSLGRVQDVLDLEPLSGKLRAFNWDVAEINGHDHHEIFTALSILPRRAGSPTAIIAHTIKGKGVDFMENSLKWHYSSPTDEEFAKAIQQRSPYEYQR